MKRTARVALAVLGTAVSLTLVLWPSPALADGGPAVDPGLFPQLKEGQQVAVVTVNDLETASVDLFVSILDQTGESHEITYFVPLGVRPSGFLASEQDSLSFANSLTNDLDVALAVEYGKSRDFVQYLFGAALLTNGAWLAPLWMPLLLTGCGEGAAPEPLSTFTTPSSQVSVFAIDEDTDLQALASTTGLAPSVADTLARLKGQQVAVIKLRTTLRSSTPASSGNGPTGEPGLHLTWTASLTVGKSGATYAYPLGTGAAWASPIDMTRVYVVAPEGLTFAVTYPKLGANCSGYDRHQGEYIPRITDDQSIAAYAIAATRGAVNVVNRYRGGPITWQHRVQVWRATYLNSNATDDILVTVRRGSGLTALGAKLRDGGSMQAFLVGYVVAIAFWLLAWWLLMPRLVGGGTGFRDVVGLASGYVTFSLLMVIPGVVLYWFGSYAGEMVFGLTIAIAAFAAVSVLFFFGFLGGWKGRLKRIGATTGLAIRNLAIVTAVSGGAYFLFAAGYAWLAGAL